MIGFIDRGRYTQSPWIALTQNPKTPNPKRPGSHLLDDPFFFHRVELCKLLVSLAQTITQESAQVLGPHEQDST